MIGAVRAAWEHVILQPAPTMGRPGDQALPRLFGKLELHRLVGLLLNDRGAVPSRGVYHELTNAELNQVTAAQLAIDGKVKHSKVANPRLPLEVEADRPDLLRFQRWFRPDKGSLVPRHHRAIG